MDGSVHSIFDIWDGKYAVSGPIENKAAMMIDLSAGKVAWEIKFDSGVCPMAFEANADGSTHRIAFQPAALSGFAVVDFAKRTQIARVMLPEHPGGFGSAEERLGTPSHGIGGAPDGKSLWVNSSVAKAVFKYSLPDLQPMRYSGLLRIHASNRVATGAVPITGLAFVMIIGARCKRPKEIGVRQSRTFSQISPSPIKILGWCSTTAAQNKLMMVLIRLALVDLASSGLSGPCGATRQDR